MRRRLPVRAYLLVALIACVLALGILTARVSTDAFDQERAHADRELRLLTQETTSAESGSNAQLAELATTYASDPGITSMDPARCEASLGGLANAITSVYLQVLDVAGQPVCSVYAGNVTVPASYRPGTWLEQALASAEPVLDGPVRDELLAAPAVTAAMAIRGEDGTARGVFAIVAATAWEIPFPDGAPDGLVLLVLTPDRSMVLATSKDAPVRPGDDVSSTVFGQPLPDNKPIADLDGERRIYVDVVVESNGEHVLAGVPEDIVTAPAREQLRKNIAIGAVTIGIVLIVGLLLNRRLARPLRRVAGAIAANLNGDDDARAPVDGPSEVARVATVFNELITERQAREADLSYQARHDSLTGLPNRAALVEHLEQALSGPDDWASIAVGFLDLDRFKHVNDAHGHAVGDQLLVALGTRLCESLDGAFVARFGGDEYVFVSDAIHDEDGAHALARRVADILRAPFHIEAQILHLAGSVGIALAEEGETAEDIIRNADTAMYHAKDTGRGKHAVFDQSMREWVVLRAATENDLHLALDRNQLEVHYQPKYRLSDGEIIGMEALLRWRHPQRGMISPADFIPVAEDCGLIVPIGTWVLEQAARQAVAWRSARDGEALPIAVNLSARQLAQVDLPAVVARTLDRAGATVEDVVLEITESAVLTDVDGATTRLRHLQDSGLRISVDDFGTGYSSLSYLQRLPINELKIDRAFIKLLPYDETSTEIVGSVIRLAHAIGLSVVAEGVEDPVQLVALDALGCDDAQGFYLGRPAPAAELLDRALANVAAR